MNKIIINFTKFFKTIGLIFFIFALFVLLKNNSILSLIIISIFFVLAIIDVILNFKYLEIIVEKDLNKIESLEIPEEEKNKRKHLFVKLHKVFSICRITGAIILIIMYFVFSI